MSQDSSKFLDKTFIHTCPPGYGAHHCYTGNPDDQVTAQVKKCLEKALDLEITPVKTGADTHSRLHNTPTEGPHNVTYDIVSAEMAEAAQISSFRLIILSNAINEFVNAKKLNEAEEFNDPASRVTNFEDKNSVPKQLPLTHLTLYPYIAERIAVDPKLIEALRDDPEVRSALIPIRDALHAADGKGQHGSKVKRHEPPKPRHDPNHRPPPTSPINEL